jgi:hypothetical protein
MSKIATTLEQFTASISQFETKRPYISLSNSIKTEEELLNEFLNGFQDGHEIRLKCYKGYQMERDLKARIEKCFCGHVGPAPEISVFNGLVQGHPDFLFDGYPADCKSVNLDEHLPINGKLPRKVYWQMQGYMLYMKAPKALVIYESRQSGFIRDFWIPANPPIQYQIDAKMRAVVSQIPVNAAV